MAALTPNEIFKYEWRVELFLRKYHEKEPFEVKGNKKVIFVENRDIVKAIKSRDSTSMTKIGLLAIDGIPYKFSDLEKSKEFGGRGAGAGTAKEDRELMSLIKQIDEAKATMASATIPIRIKNKVFEIFTAESTPGTPKSDFHLVDIDQKEVVWISHKDGRSAKDFQQWGGISQRIEPLIYNHPETQKFIKDLKQVYPNGLPPKTTLGRKIIDKKLKLMSVYGNEYGRQLGRQNTSIMLQGPVKLVKKGNVYELDSNHVHYNGEDMINDYEPIFMAIYKGDRSDAGVKGTRIVISPIGGRKLSGVF